MKNTPHSQESLWQQAKQNWPLIAVVSAIAAVSSCAPCMMQSLFDRPKAVKGADLSKTPKEIDPPAVKIESELWVDKDGEGRIDNIIIIGDSNGGHRGQNSNMLEQPTYGKLNGNENQTIDSGTSASDVIAADQSISSLNDLRPRVDIKTLRLAVEECKRYEEFWRAKAERGEPGAQIRSEEWQRVRRSFEEEISALEKKK